MGEREHLTRRQRERGGEKRGKTKRVEKEKGKSGGIDLRAPLGQLKQLKKELGLKAVSLVPELDKLDALLIEMKKVEGDPAELQAEFQATLQEVRDKAAGVGVAKKGGEAVGDSVATGKPDEKEKKDSDAGERLAAKMGLDEDTVTKAEIDARREEVTEKWNEWDKKEGIFTLPDGSKIEMRGGGPLGYCIKKFRPRNGKEWFDGVINFIYKYRKREKDGNLERGLGTERARIRILFRGAQAEKFEVDVEIGERNKSKKSGSGLVELKQMLSDARKSVGEEVEKQFTSSKPVERGGPSAEALKRNTHVPKGQGIVSQSEPEYIEDIIGNLKEPLVKQSVGAARSSERPDNSGEKPEKKEVVETAKAFGSYALWFFKMRKWVAEQRQEFWQKNNDFAKFSQFTGIKEEKHWRILFAEFAQGSIKEKDEDLKDGGHNGTQFLDNASAVSAQDISPAPQSAESRRVVELEDELTDPKEDKKRFEHYEFLAERTNLDKKGVWQDAINKVIFTLAAESGLRPLEDGVVEGNGIVDLKHPELPTVYIPDLHARRYMLLEILKQKNESGRTYFDLLREGKINIIAGGDAIHSEGRNKERWKKADESGDGSIVDNSSMNGEMVESLNTVKMVMDLKNAFPENFHYISGNHDNHNFVKSKEVISKYANEQVMMENWLCLNFDQRWQRHSTGEINEDKGKLTEEERLKKGLLDLYVKFEKSLPLAVRSKEFIASHAVPAKGLPAPEQNIKNKLSEATSILEWGDSGAGLLGRQETAVNMMTDVLLKAKGCEEGKGLWFGAHRNHDADAGQKIACFGRAWEINHSHDGVFIYFNPDKFANEGAQSAVEVKRMPLARQEEAEKKKMALIKTDELFV